MSLYKKRKSAISIFIVILVYGCQHSINTVDHIYYYQPPLYDHTSLIVHPDTLQFKLGENVYNQIKSFNLFRDKGVDYIGFYDRRSESINIYYLIDQRFCRNIPLKKLFKNRQIYKTSVFVKNWDSIFVINKSTIRLFDSSGRRKQKIEFPTKPDGNAAIFDSNRLPVFIGNKLFAISRNRVNDQSLNALRDWKVMYVFDLEKGKTQLLYHLPSIYQENLYGDRFLEYNFCYNNRGKFVFSFPADTLLYETSLTDYNHSYFARSQVHQDILPVSEQALKNKQGLKEYAIRNSYGSVFYDAANKYYLRLVRHKINPEEFEAKKRQRLTVMILNENFQIIGESDWPEGVDFDSLFFTPHGKLYARTNYRDEYTLKFVRFDYQDNKGKPEPLVQK